MKTAIKISDCDHIKIRIITSAAIGIRRPFVGGEG